MGCSNSGFREGQADLIGMPGKGDPPGKRTQTVMASNGPSDRQPSNPVPFEGNAVSRERNWSEAKSLSNGTP